MIIGSTKEDLSLEKRVALTPEAAKNIIGLGLKICIEKNYASHIGIKDEDYKELGVLILRDDKDIISDADIIVQLGLLSEDKNSLLKENQTFIGVLNPYDNTQLQLLLF